MTAEERNEKALKYISDAAEFGDDLEAEILIEILTPPDEPKLVWKFGCKHGFPNFVHCPECDGKK